MTQWFRTLIRLSKGLYSTALLSSLCVSWLIGSFWHRFGSSVVVSWLQFCYIGHLHRVFFSQWMLTRFFFSRHWFSYAVSFCNIMAKGFCFMLLGLVRLRTFRLSAWVTSGQHKPQVFTRADGADVSLRDVTIIQMGNGARECRWRHAPEARGGFWGFWRKSVGWVESCLGRRRLTFACLPKPGQWRCAGCPMCWVGQMEKPE